MEQIIEGTFVVDPADRDTWLAGRLDLIRRSRAEPGCIAYVFAADPLEPGVIVLYERWESEEALEGHRKALQSSPPADPGAPTRSGGTRQFAASDVPQP